MLISLDKHAGIHPFLYYFLRISVQRCHDLSLIPLTLSFHAFKLVETVMGDNAFIKDYCFGN